MTAYTASTLLKPAYAGSQGNQSAWRGYHKMAAAASGATDTVDLIKIPAGARVDLINFAWSAHGGSGTISLGWRYASGKTGGTATALLAATSTVSAGNATSSLIPENVAALGSSGNASGVFDEDIIVYATSAATAMPSGFQLSVIAEGEYVGLL